MRLHWKDSENNQQRTSEVYLGEWKDRDERGETAIYRDQQLARIEDFTERLLDLLDYYPSGPNEKLSYNNEQKLFIDLKMEHYDGAWSTEYEKQRDRWNTDMLKFYFAGERGQNVVLTCIAGGTWINATGEWQAHPCKIQRSDHPAKALQMIEAHTCNILYSSSASDTIQFKICRNMANFDNFDRAQVQGDCCETNTFSAATNYQPGLQRNSYARIDTLERDGGEALGRCEGFEITGKTAYIVINSNSTDEGCFDELKFYGEPGVNGSVLYMPFLTCAFTPVEFESHQTRWRGDYIWRREKDDLSAIHCSGGVEALHSLEIGACDVHYAGSYDTFKTTICTGKSSTGVHDCCETGWIGDIRRGKGKVFGGDNLGTCRGRKLERYVSVKFSHPGTDALCIDYLKFNQNPVCQTCIWTDSSQVEKCNTEWKSPTELAVQCNIDEGNTIKKLSVKVCDNERGGTSDKLVVHMENDAGEKCTSSGLKGPETNHWKEYSPSELGPGCKKFQVTDTTHIWLYTDPGNDDLCLTDIYLDVSDWQTGSTKSVRCRFDQNKKFELTFQGEPDGIKAIPLKCI